MSDWYEQLSDEEKAEIETGIKQADSNEFVDHDMVMSRFLKWHKYLTNLDKHKTLES